MSGTTLSLGLILVSFILHCLFLVKFIDFLYRMKMTRRSQSEDNKNTINSGQKEFDNLHDKKTGTPIGGGILIISLAQVLFWLVYVFFGKSYLQTNTSFKLTSELFILFFTFNSFGVLGFVDDVVKIFGKPKKNLLASTFGLSTKQKLSVQIVLSLFIGWMLYTLLGIHILNVPMTGIVLDLGWFYIPFASLVILFFLNAFNFTDGIDGLAGGLLMIYLFAYIFISANHLDIPLSLFIAIWLGGIISFLYFNVYPARIFLGDTGSLSFGATIAVIGLMMGNIAVLFVVGGIFVIEAFSSAIQIFGWRVLKRRILPLAPIHHTFQLKGWSEPKIVMRAWLLAIILAIFGLLMSLAY